MQHHDCRVPEFILIAAVVVVVVVVVVATVVAIVDAVNLGSRRNNDHSSFFFYYYFLQTHSDRERERERDEKKRTKKNDKLPRKKKHNTGRLVRGAPLWLVRREPIMFHGKGGGLICIFNRICKWAASATLDDALFFFLFFFLLARGGVDLISLVCIRVWFFVYFYEPFPFSTTVFVLFFFNQRIFFFAIFFSRFSSDCRLWTMKM